MKMTVLLGLLFCVALVSGQDNWCGSSAPTTPAGALVCEASKCNPGCGTGQACAYTADGKGFQCVASNVLTTVGGANILTTVGGLVGGIVGGLLGTVAAVVGNVLAVTSALLNNLATALTVQAGSLLALNEGTCGCNGTSLVGGVLNLVAAPVPLLGQAVIKPVILTVGGVLNLALTTLAVTAAKAACILNDLATLAVGALTIGVQGGAKPAALAVVCLDTTVGAVAHLAVNVVTLLNGNAGLSLNGKLQAVLGLCTLNGGLLNIGAGVAVAGQIVAGVGTGGLINLGGAVNVLVSTTLGLAANVAAAVNAAVCLNVAGIVNIAAGITVGVPINVALNALVNVAAGVGITAPITVAAGGLLCLDGAGITLAGVNLAAQAVLAIDARVGVVIPVVKILVADLGAILRVQVASVTALLQAGAGVQIPVLSHLVADIRALANLKVQLFDCTGAVLDVALSLNVWATAAAGTCQGLLTAAGNVAGSLVVRVL